MTRLPSGTRFAVPGWGQVFLASLGGILILRLLIWKSLRLTEVFFREDFANVLVAAGIMLLAFVWAARKFVCGESFRASGLELPVFLLAGSAACSLFYTADFPASLQGLLVLGAEIAFFYMLIDALDTPRRIRQALFFFIAMAGVVSVFGVKEFLYLWTRPGIDDPASLAKMNQSLSYILMNRRVVSFLGWPNSLAGYLLLILPLVLVLPFHLKNFGHRLLSGLMGVAVLACFLFTFSFLGWVSFILATLALLPVFWEKGKIAAWPREKKALLWGGICIFACLFLWVILRKDFLGSLMPRVLYYREALGLLTQKPFLGHGWGTFGILGRQFATDPAGLSAYVHNSYLQVWVEAGLAGFAGISLLALVFYRKALQAIRTLGHDENVVVMVAVVWGLTAFLIDNVFSFTILKPNIALYGWAMLAVWCALLKRESVLPVLGARALSRLFSGAVLAVAALMLVLLMRFAGGYAYYYQARYGKTAHVYQEALGNMSRAAMWDPWSSYLPAGVGNLHLMVFGNTRDHGFLREAQGMYLEAIHRSPSVYSYYLVVGDIYQTLGDQRLAHLFNARASQLSPLEFQASRAAVKMQMEAARKAARGADGSALK